MFENNSGTLFLCCAAFQTEGKLYLILEFLRGGDLFTRLSKEVSPAMLSALWGAPTFPIRQHHKRQGISVTLMYAVQCHVSRVSWSWRGDSESECFCDGSLRSNLGHRMICERLGTYWRVKFVFSVAAVGVVNLVWGYLFMHCWVCDRCREWPFWWCLCAEQVEWLFLSEDRFRCFLLIP